MAERVLKIAKCSACPFVEPFVTGCKAAARNFVDERGFRTTHPQTIPDWCPLPKVDVTHP